MLGLLLQEAALDLADLGLTEAGVLGGLYGLIAGFVVAFSIIAIAVYIYSALAFMKIAKRTNTEPAWLAWIPIANLYLFSKIAKMHWWPILLIIGMFIPFVNFIAPIVLMVFVYIWMWRIFEAVGRPGWWPLLSLIPIVGPVIFLVLLGVAAWGK